jgi:hypothetical protein
MCSTLKGGAMRRLLLAAILFIPGNVLAADVAGYKVTRADGSVLFGESYETVRPFHRIKDFENHTTLHHIKDVVSIEPLRWSDLKEARDLASKNGSEWGKAPLFAARTSFRTSARSVARREEPSHDGVCGAPREDGTSCQTPVEGGGYCAVHEKKFSHARELVTGDSSISSKRRQELQRTVELRRDYKAKSRAASASRQAQVDEYTAALAQQEAVALAQQQASMAYGGARSSYRGGYYTGPRQPAGYYAGCIGSSHLGGHYVNPFTGNHYQQRH